MIRRDEEAAGIAHEVDGPEGKSFRDFHNLRHTFVSFLDQSGATLKEAMELARHSDPRLTAKVYGRAARERLAEAVKKLPTGTSTGNSTDADASVVCRRFAQTIGDDSQNGGTLDESGTGERPVESAEKTGQNATITDQSASSARRIRTFNPPVNSRLLYR
jgi:hypothetical protein